MHIAVSVEGTLLDACSTSEADVTIPKELEIIICK